MTTGQRRDVIPTRAMLRDLEAEHQVAKEGREFLDQKRMLLATEMLRRIQRAEELRRRIDELQVQATSALAAGVARHGLEGLQCHPVAPLRVRVEAERERFIGIGLLETRLQREGSGDSDAPPRAINPSPEARHCGDAFRELLPALTELAGITSSLYRLGREYRQTNRRVRALERVLMPEIEGTLRKVTEVLDEQDQEEAIYARLSRR